MPISTDVLRLMANRRDAPAPLVLLHGVWSTGSGWYPQAIVAFEPFYAMMVPRYGQLLTWADTFEHWSTDDAEREEEFLRIAEEVMAQLPEALAATDPAWVGPRPSVVAHSYGTILIYRFLRDSSKHVVDRVLLRGTPLRQSTSFLSWSGRHTGAHSLLGGGDIVVRFAPLMRAVGRFLGSSGDRPPHPASLGTGMIVDPDTHRSAGLGGGHLAKVDGDRPESWECEVCKDGYVSDVHTWLVDTWDHTTVSRDDVHRYWFPLILGWEPARWAAYVDSLRELVPTPDERYPNVDTNRLQQWIEDDSLEVFWRPHRTAAEFIRAALQCSDRSHAIVDAFVNSVGNYELAIARLFVVPARRALDAWFLAKPPVYGPDGYATKAPRSDDPRRALLPEALATLTRDILARWVMHHG